MNPDDQDHVKFIKFPNTPLPPRTIFYIHYVQDWVILIVMGMHQSSLTFPHKRPVMWSFDVIFVFNPNKLKKYRIAMHLRRHIAYEASL